jgi:hypothetical protein
MKKISGLIMILFLAATMASAAMEKGSLTVFCESNDMEIYVDNDFITKGQASLVDLVPGKHYLKALYQGKIIFSDLVDVDPTKANTILVKFPVDLTSLMPNNKPVAATQESTSENTFKQFGVGFEVGWPFYGLNFEYWPLKEHGLSLDYYASTDTSGNYATHYSLRYKYKITPAFYLALGAGKYTDNRYANYGGSDYTFGYEEADYGVFFGIIPNDFMTFEFGYGQRLLPSAASTSMVTASTGIHYYF